MVPPQGPTRLSYVSISPQNTFLSIETLQNAGIGFTELFDSEKLCSLEPKNLPSCQVQVAFEFISQQNLTVFVLNFLPN